MESFQPEAVLRMVLILLHLLAFAAAMVGTAFGDFAVFARRRVDTRLLQRAARGVVLALALLWLTGLAVVVVDLGWDIGLWLERPKLMAKLTVVTVLTLNGIALHRHAFERLSQAHDDARAAAWLPSVLGAVSAASWFFAVFIGVGKSVAPLLGYAGFMLLYAGVLLVAVATALTLVRPRLARQLAPATVVPSSF